MGTPEGLKAPDAVGCHVQAGGDALLPPLHEKNLFFLTLFKTKHSHTRAITDVPGATTDRGTVVATVNTDFL